jgi:hypothetical protein
MVGIYIAVQVRDISRYQANISRLEHVPIISLRTLRTEEKGKPRSERLIIYNTGAPPQHFRCSVTTLLIVGYKKALREEAIDFVLPISDWFYTYRINPDEKDVIFTAHSPDFGNLEQFPTLISRPGPGKGFYKFNPREIQHLVNIRYTNLLDENIDEYYLVSETDYMRLDYKRGQELSTGLTQLTDGWPRLDKELLEKINVVGEKAVQIESLRVQRHAENTVNVFAY